MGKQERYFKRRVVFISNRRVYGISKAAEIKATVDKEIVKLDEKLKRLMRLRLEDEIPKDSYLELKKEIEQEKIELINKRRVLDAGMVPNEDGEEPAKKVEDFLLSKMDFTEHYIDREVIKQFVHTIVPVTETCFNWYMNFDLIEKPNDMKSWFGNLPLIISRHCLTERKKRYAQAKSMARFNGKGVYITKE